MRYSLAVVLLLVSCCWSLPTFKILSYDSDNHSRSEQGLPGSSVSGHYSWNVGDKIFRVDYVADDNGYRPVLTVQQFGGDKQDSMSQQSADQQGDKEVVQSVETNPKPIEETKPGMMQPADEDRVPVLDFDDLMLSESVSPAKDQVQEDAADDSVVVDALVVDDWNDPSYDREQSYDASQAYYSPSPYDQSSSYYASLAQYPAFQQAQQRSAASKKEQSRRDSDQEKPVVNSPAAQAQTSSSDPVGYTTYELDDQTIRQIILALTPEQLWAILHDKPFPEAVGSVSANSPILSPDVRGYGQHYQFGQPLSYDFYSQDNQQQLYVLPSY